MTEETPNQPEQPKKPQKKDFSKVFTKTANLDPPPVVPPAAPEDKPIQEDPLAFLEEEQEQRPYKERYKQRGLYIENDLDDILTAKSKRKQGAKTAIVNQALRELFERRGWL